MDINHYNNLNGKEIAVIGMAGRLPMADSLDVFWDNLKMGREGVIVIRYYLALRGAENGVTVMVTPFFCVQG